MKYLLIPLAFLLVGCESSSSLPASSENTSPVRWYLSGAITVDRIEDPEKGVTCWVSDGYRSGGISCLPILPPQQ